MADFVAICSGQQLITTQVDEIRWGNTWLMTELGMEYLHDLKEILDVEDTDITD